MVVYSLPCDCSPWGIIHWVLFVCFIIIIIIFFLFVMDPFLHCDHLNREEGADYLTFLCFVACVFHGLFALPLGVTGRLSSVIVALPWTLSVLFLHIQIPGFPNLAFWQFLHQNLVLDSQKLQARVLSGAYMINPKSILFIYGKLYFNLFMIYRARIINI